MRKYRRQSCTVIAEHDISDHVRTVILIRIARAWRARAVLGGTVLVTNAGCAGFSHRTEPDAAGPTYEVYSALIREAVLGAVAPAEVRGGDQIVQRASIVLTADLDSIFPGSAPERLRQVIPTLGPETLSDFNARKPFRPLERRFEGIGAYELVNGAELFGDGGKKLSRLRGTHGFVRLSRIGFNREHTQALVVLTHKHESAFYVLERSHTGWKVVGREVFLEY
jgi:hypothetical protein